MQLVDRMTNTEFIDSIRKRITDDTTHDLEYYGPNVKPQQTSGTSQISVIAENGDAVSVSSSVNFV